MRFQFNRIVRPVVAIILGGGFGCFLSLYPVRRQVPNLPVIAFIPRTSGTNFTEDMRRGAFAAVRNSGYRIYWNAPTREDDVDRQVVLAETAVRRGAKAVILGPTNIWGVTTMVNSFVAHKIPVIFVQTNPAEPTGPYLTSVTPDQTQIGMLAAMRIAKVMGGSGQVAIVGIDRGTPETLKRAQSFIQAASAFPGIAVVAQSAGAEQTLEAEQSARELVTTFPHLKAIFAVSADATQGAMLALQDLDTSHGIALVGCDRDLFLQMNLHERKLDSLVSADGYRIGYLAAEAALAGVNDHPLPAPQYVPPELLTQTNQEFSDSH
jgi:ribose transport system substrate-binding protein